MKNLTIEQIVNIFLEKQVNNSRYDILVHLAGKLNTALICQGNKHARNLVISFNNKPDREDDKIIVLGAHYDVYPNSTGINDNTVAVATLLKVAQALIENGTDKRIDIVFFDREEDGMYGSSLYIDTVGHWMIDHAIILDVIGYGDTFLTSTRETTATSRAIRKALNTFVPHEPIRQVLVSDNVVFNRYGIENVLIVAAPRSDLKLHNDNYYTLKGHSSFYDTFHNRKLDNIPEIMNYPLVDKLYNALVIMYG